MSDLSKRLITAIEGECDGLAITDAQASNILAYLQYGEPMQGADARPVAITVPSVEEMQAALTLAQDSIAQLERERTVTRDQLNTPIGPGSAMIDAFAPFRQFATRDAEPSNAQDAARYRWLLDHPEYVEYGAFFDRSSLGPMATVSDAIDKAIAASAPRNET